MSMTPSQYAAFLRRTMLAYAERVGEGDESDVAEMVELRKFLDQMTARAIAIYLASDADVKLWDRSRTWRALARAMGVKTQSVHGRYAKAVEREKARMEVETSIRAEVGRERRLANRMAA